ncbi:hypothetical protein D3C81_1625080 [compost metagenome]
MAWSSLRGSPAYSARIAPTSRAISCASNDSRARPSSLRALNSASLRGSGACMQARSSVTITIRLRSSSCVPRVMYCIAIC